MIIIYILSFLFGAFFLNNSFSFISIPFISSVNQWILFLGGIYLLILGIFAHKIKWIFSIPYLIFGLYFINYPFNFVKMPEFVVSLESWIVLASGICFLVGVYILSSFKRKTLASIK